MYEKTAWVIGQVLRVLVPPTVASVVFFLLWSASGVERQQQPLELLVVPTSAPTPEPAPRVDPLPSPLPTETPIHPRSPIVIHTTNVSDWLGVVDMRRSEMQRLLHSFNGLHGSARVVPHERGGEIDGFRIYNVRRGTILWALGLRNNDVIHTVNDTPITSPANALSVYSAMPDAYDVRLTRGGRPARLLILLHGSQNS